MSEYWDHHPPSPESQYTRLEPLKQLASRNIPCILWGEDVLNFAYGVPTSLFDQQIIVPDALLQSASAVVREGPYTPTVPAWDYVEKDGPRKGTSPFPEAIRLKHSDVPDDGDSHLGWTPEHILLLPQSYFGLDFQSSERFKLLPIPLDRFNPGILIPNYNTFLEGLVYFIMNPPTGWDNPHRRGKMKHDILIGYLIEWRVRYDFDDVDAPPPKRELLPEEEKILSELTTDEARWYINFSFWERRFPKFDDIREYRGGVSRSSSGTVLPRLKQIMHVPRATPGISRSFSTRASTNPPGSSHTDKWMLRILYLRAGGDHSYARGAMDFGMATTRLLRRVLP